MQHIYFYHMRKCGGTTIRRAIEEYAAQNYLRYTPEEGSPFGYSLFHNIRFPVAEVLAGRAPLLDGISVVTNLRNPVERVFSSCIDYLVRRQQTNLAEHFRQNFFNKGSLSFELVTSNYFIKCLLRWRKEVTAKEYDLALQLLETFDCVYLLDERMAIKHAGFPNLGLGHRNQLGDARYAPFLEVMAGITPEVIEANYWDIKLYRHFCTKYPQEHCHLSDSWKLQTDRTRSGTRWVIHKVEFQFNETKKEGKFFSSQPLDGAATALTVLPDDRGSFYLGIEDRVLSIVHRILLLQGEDHWTDHLEVCKKMADGSWKTVCRASGLQPGMNEIVLSSK